MASITGKSASSSSGPSKILTLTHYERGNSTSSTYANPVVFDTLLANTSSIVTYTAGVFKFSDACAVTIEFLYAWNSASHCCPGQDMPHMLLGY